jgi:hypothetical protein
MRSSRASMALTTETDGFRIRGREVYWWRRKKPGTSLFSTVPFPKVLASPSPSAAPIRSESWLRSGPRVTLQLASHGRTRS